MTYCNIAMALFPAVLGIAIGSIAANIMMILASGTDTEERLRLHDAAQRQAYEDAARLCEMPYTTGSTGSTLERIAATLRAMASAVPVGSND